MDWKDCQENRIVKDVKTDKNMINSTREIADIKIRSAEALPGDLYIGKISLLYDALRELLEAEALERNFKIYNHECYSAFLKEVMNMSRDADIFDRLRKTRNSINYYGKKVSEEEANKIIEDMYFLIRKFR